MKYNWQIAVGLLLFVLSAALYLFHYLIFHDAHHIGIFMLGDIAFVPIEILFVTLIVDHALSEREKKSRLQKMNMVIGVFYNTVGCNMLSYFYNLDSSYDEIEKRFADLEVWTEGDFQKAKDDLKNFKCSMKVKREDLEDIRRCFDDKRDFLLGLLENPNLLEHETFTDLLWATFHLQDELSHRDNFSELSNNDLKHLIVDMERAYSLLILEWLDYMKHLKQSYPYLFSFAVRTNPFNRSACVEFSDDK